MMKILAFICLLATTTLLHAQSVTSLEKTQFYNGCFPSCKSNQRENPVNGILLDVPFVLDAYCSCYCSRVSMRLTRPQVNFLMRAGIEGRSLTENPSLQKLIDESGTKCVEAFF